MPLLCSDDVLTGQDGSVYLTPPGTTVCLLDYTDFTATGIQLPSTHNFQVGDPVIFTAKGTANLDSGLTEDEPGYVISSIGVGTNIATLNEALDGTPVTLNEDGGTGTADTPGARQNHIEMAMAMYDAVCNVKRWTFNMTRGRIDTTAIPCGPVTAESRKIAPFRTSQSGYIDGTGTIEMQIAREAQSLAARFLEGSLYRVQAGARVRLYHDIELDDTGSAVDMANSIFYEGPVTVEGFSTGASTDDEAIMATINFSLSGQPTHIFRSSF